MRRALSCLCLFLLIVPAAAQDSAKIEGLKNHAIAAARAQNWDEAVDDLYEAQDLARTDASVLYLLGVVESRAGNDVPGMFWLRAYLAAAPSAQNRTDVARQIASNEANARTKEQDLYRAAEKLAGSDLADVAREEARALHLSDALRLLGGGDRDEVWKTYADSLMSLGDTTRGEDALSHVAKLAALVADQCDYKPATSGQGPATAYLHHPGDPDRWNGLTRRDLLEHYFACSFRVGGACPFLEHRVDQTALAAISDASLRAEAAQEYATIERVSNRPAAAMPLEAWLECAESSSAYDQRNLDRALDPKRLEDEASGTGESVPQVIARMGSQIGMGIAEFHAVESALGR